MVFDDYGIPDCPGIKTAVDESFLVLQRWFDEKRGLSAHSWTNRFS